MEVEIENCQNDLEVDLTLIEQLAKFTLKKKKIPESAQLSIALVTEEKIRELNAKYRGITTPTDVLSFPMLEDLPQTQLPQLLGDVVICPQIAAQQAKRLRHSLNDEVCLLLVHGILHLLGYNHKKEAEARKMEVEEEKILEDFRVLWKKEA